MLLFDCNFDGTWTARSPRTLAWPFGAGSEVNISWQKDLMAAVLWSGSGEERKRTTCTSRKAAFSRLLGNRYLAALATAVPVAVSGENTLVKE